MTVYAEDGIFVVTPNGPPVNFLQFLQWHRLVRAESGPEGRVMV